METPGTKGKENGNVTCFYVYGNPCEAYLEKITQQPWRAYWRYILTWFGHLSVY